MPTAAELIGQNVLAHLIATISRAVAVPDRDLVALRQCEHELEALGLRKRSDLMKDALLADLPGDYDSFDQIVRTCLEDPTCTGWLIWPISEAVTAKALADGSPEAFDAALILLADLTPRLSSEFAIRPLLAEDLDRALTIVQQWTQHPDEHVRRLASEGTRGFLPWAKRVNAILAHPEKTIPIIDALYRDEQEYVRRSVANHLNDLSRQQPELVVAVATRWLADPDANTGWVVRHGLRTLIKKGYPPALALMGFTPQDGITVTGPILERLSIAVGEELPFTITIENTTTESVSLAIDYVIHHMKANGTQTAKVFKLTTKKLSPGESFSVSRRHSFKPISTRAYYPGEHAIEVQVNGERFGRAPFDLAVIK